MGEYYAPNVQEIKSRVLRMFNVGQLCLKIAGRDAGQQCVVVEKIDEQYVLIEGNVRRRKCNIKHLQPTKKKLDIKAGADHKTVMVAFKKEGIKELKKAGFKKSGVSSQQSGEKKAKPAKKAEVKKEKPKAEAKKTPAKK